MRQRPIYLMLLCLGVNSHVRAADPPAPSSSAVQPGQPAPAAAATAPSTTVSSAAATADLQKSEPGAKSDVTPLQMKTLRSAGYKPEVRNGQTLFCRAEHVLGSRLEKKVCGTAADIERSTQNSQELAERIQTKAYVKAPGSP